MTVLCAGELPPGLLGLILHSNMLLMSSRLSLVPSLGYSASRASRTKPATGGNEDHMDRTDLLSLPLLHTKTLFRPSGYQ